MTKANHCKRCKTYFFGETCYQCHRLVDEPEPTSTEDFKDLFESLFGPGFGKEKK